MDSAANEVSCDLPLLKEIAFAFECSTRLARNICIEVARKHGFCLLGAHVVGRWARIALDIIEGEQGQPGWLLDGLLMFP